MLEMMDSKVREWVTKSLSDGYPRESAWRRFPIEIRTWVLSQMEFEYHRQTPGFSHNISDTSVYEYNDPIYKESSRLR